MKKIAAAVLIYAAAVWLPESRPESAATFAAYFRAVWPLILACAAAALIYFGGRFESGRGNRRRVRHPGKRAVERVP